MKFVVSLAPSTFCLSGICCEHSDVCKTKFFLRCSDTDFISCADHWSQLVDQTSLTGPGVGMEKQRSWDTLVQGRHLRGAGGPLTPRKRKKEKKKEKKEKREKKEKKERREL